MKADDIIAALKEFFLEILGFLLPGMTFVMLCIFMFEANLQKKCLDFIDSDKHSLIFIFGSYLVGYVIYGLSNILDKIKIHDFLSNFGFHLSKQFDNQVSEKIMAKPEYKIVQEALSNMLNVQLSEIQALPYKDVRSLAMSYVPEIDKKVYSFTFRAELSEKTCVALQMIAFLGLLSKALSFLKIPSIFRVEAYYDILSYVSLLIFAYLLRETYKRFYEIAMKIIFPIFAIKYKMLQTNNTQNAA